MSSGNAFTNPTLGKIDQQRKILEDLKQQRKLLKQGQNSATPSPPPQQQQQQLLLQPVSASAGSSAAPVNTNGSLDSNPETHLLSANQRAAMDVATKTSFGYFLTQDSSFGNLILPVIPRLPSQVAP